MTDREIPSDRAEAKREGARDSSLSARKIAQVRRKVAMAKRKLLERLRKRREF